MMKTQSLPSRNLGSVEEGRQSESRVECSQSTAQSTTEHRLVGTGSEGRPEKDARRGLLKGNGE